MIKNYVLMNKNTKVLEFKYDTDLNVITKIENISNIEYAPLDIKNALEEKITVEMNNWFNNRAIPICRDDLKDILEVFGISNVKELINRDYALSVSDQYWFKPEDEEIKWENINYFDKDYDSMAFAEGTYGSGAGTSLKQSKGQAVDKTPNNTSNGQLKKVWIKKNGENHLYKGSGTIHKFEPINEVLASKICEILEVPHVKYTLDVVKSKRQDTLVSVCKCIINKDEEIIPAYSILTEKSNKVTKTIEDYNTYLQILKEHKVPNAEEYLQKMLMLDYIMLNEDRHLNNFGIIRDVNTLEWKRICPIFDTGRSMNTNVTAAYWDFKEGEVKCFTTQLILASNLEKIFTIKISKDKIDSLLDLSRDYRDMLTKYQEYTKLKDEEIDMLVGGYITRVEIFKKKVLEV